MNCLLAIIQKWTKKLPFEDATFRGFDISTYFKGRALRKPQGQRWAPNLSIPCKRWPRHFVGWVLALVASDWPLTRHNWHSSLVWQKWDLLNLVKEKLVASDVPLRKKKVPLSNWVILKIFKKVYLEIIIPLRPRMIYKEGYSFSAIGVSTFAPGHSLPGYKL